MLHCVASIFKGRSGLVSVESPGAHKVLFEPLEHLSWVWGLILITISPLLPSFWGFSSALGRGVYFFGGIQHSLVDSCSSASCNFGVFTGEGECMSFYSAILNVISQWRVLTKCGPLEKRMANHFCILALRTPWTLWKDKRIGHWKMNSQVSRCSIYYWRRVEK